MYQNILFDLDGTLTEPGLGITNSVAYALEKWNIKVADRTSLYKFIGPPLMESFMTFYGFSEEKAAKSVEYYREYFSVKGLYENELYPDTVKLLESLKKLNKKIVLATSKPEVYATEILKHFDLYKYFDYVAGATMDETRNKKGDVIKYALESANITELSNTVMIGDREHDIFGAKEAGIDSIGVLYGYGNCKELVDAGATYIAEKAEDILCFI